MILFILTFLAIYTGMHALVFWGVHPLVKGHPALPTLTWVWMGIMILAPLLVRLLERGGLEGAARALAWVGYSWMGGVFLAFSLFALLGVWELVALLGNRLPGVALPSLHGASAALLVVLGVLAACFYGLYEAATLRVESVRLETAKLPPDAAPLRIVQVSDLHLGLIHREEALAPLVARIEQLRPDLLVATGDIVDAQLDHLQELAVLWNRLDPPLGKFAVTGNHEFYAGLEQALDFLRRSGFTVLRNQSEQAGEQLVVAGVDDPTGGEVDEAALLREVASSRFVLLLKHRPRSDEQSAGLFDLQLSGHAHRGQIFPFNLLTGLAYPMQNGLYPLSAGARLYASRGTGTWGPPLRILSPPEITLIELHPRQQPE